MPLTLLSAAEFQSGISASQYKCYGKPCFHEWRGLGCSRRELLPALDSSGTAAPEMQSHNFGARAGLCLALTWMCTEIGAVLTCGTDTLQAPAWVGG